MNLQLMVELSISGQNELIYEIPHVAHSVMINGSNNYLSVAEVQVYDENNKLISKNKPATQSSDCSESKGTADRAVDLETQIGGWVEIL